MCTCGKLGGHVFTIACIPFNGERFGKLLLDIQHVYLSHIVNGRSTVNTQCHAVTYACRLPLYILWRSSYMLAARYCHCGADHTVQVSAHCHLSCLIIVNGPLIMLAHDDVYTQAIALEAPHIPPCKMLPSLLDHFASRLYRHDLAQTQ